MFEMTLKSVGNPDFGQYAPLSEPRTVRARTLCALRKAALAYQEEWDLGGGNWVAPVVRDGAGQVVGYFSYNGRLWEGLPKNWKSAAKEILLARGVGL